MFLLYDKIQHQKLWEEFFSQDPLKQKYSIYSHPKMISEKTPQWIIDNSVKTVKTDWCSENLVKALCLMLKKALKDKKNKYFAFLSGACIPLLTFSKTYNKINKFNKSQIYLFDKTNKIYEYKASQWIILTRKVARDLIRLYDSKDKRSQKFMKKQRSLFLKPKTQKKNKRKWEESNADMYGKVGACPDEVYPINWFINLYGDPKSQNFKKHIGIKLTTWIEWKEGNDSPEKVNIKTLDIYRKTICNSIFARKFSNNSAKLIGLKCK